MKLNSALPQHLGGAVYLKILRKKYTCTSVGADVAFGEDSGQIYACMHDTEFNAL